MTFLTAALVAVVAVCAAALWALTRVLAVASPAGTPSAREDAIRGRTLQLLSTFGPAAAAGAADPHALLAWHPVAAAARRLFPDEFAALDRAAGATFPFNPKQIEAVHARWSAEWLAWEGSHDAEFKLRAQAAEADLAASGGSPLARARLEAVEREKLEQYQRRYEEYVRVGKALQTLLHV